MSSKMESSLGKRRCNGERGYGNCFFQYYCANFVWDYPFLSIFFPSIHPFLFFLLVFMVPGGSVHVFPWKFFQWITPVVVIYQWVPPFSVGFVSWIWVVYIIIGVIVITYFS